MKITYTCYPEGLIHNRNSLQYKLFLHLQAQAYPERQHLPLVVDFRDMAIQLRKLDWKIYYWKCDAQDEEDYMDNGHREGLIIGKYCGNFMAWLLAHI